MLHPGYVLIRAVEQPSGNDLRLDLGGGLSALLGRIRSSQDKDFWGTLDNARHGKKAAKDFDYYLQNNMVFDTAGFCGAIGAVKGALIEIPASRIVFATDYPQEIRKREAVRDFVHDLRALGTDGERILSGNVGLLLKEPPAPERTKIEERIR